MYQHENCQNTYCYPFCPHIFLWSKSSMGFFASSQTSEILVSKPNLQLWFPWLFGHQGLFIFLLEGAPQPYFHNSIENLTSLSICFYFSTQIITMVFSLFLLFCSKGSFIITAYFRIFWSIWDSYPHFSSYNY